MKIRMKEQILGTRNGLRWPAPGEMKELPDNEAAELCAAGLAVPVEDKDGDVEKAVAPQPEKRGPGRPRKNAEDA